MINIAIDGPAGAGKSTAAKLAAKNSKAATSSNVPVDYTPIKYVKKPSGAKAGMVVYTTNKTIFVTPEDNL